MVTVLVTQEDWADPVVPLPDYASAGAAGADLRANLAVEDRGTGLILAPMARRLVPVGLRFELPDGYEMQIRPRSGLALRHGVTLVNAPGTVDADYRGPVGVLMINLGPDPVVIAHGERIAQAIVAPVARARFQRADALGATARGAGGFGSTGRS
ncbi:dUTP pyrophosphatase [Rhodobacteraceae bacterium MBR-64]|jgi:dUTP pyrophosphatase